MQHCSAAFSYLMIMIIINSLHLQGTLPFLFFVESVFDAFANGHVAGWHPSVRLFKLSQQLYFAPFVSQTPGWYFILNCVP